MKKYLVALLLVFSFNTLKLFSADFIHGFYAVHNTDAAFETMKELGCTHVHGYFSAFLSARYAQLETQMNLAEKHGLKVMFHLLSQGIERKEDGLEKILEVVDYFKDHPALGMWYLYDEPHGEYLKNRLPEIYFYLKRATPNIPVALCLAQTEDWRDFVESCDYLMGDVYPVNNEIFPNAPLFRYSGFLEQLVSFNKPVIGIPQFMNWKSYPSHSKAYDQKTLRYPSAQELKYFFYSSLAVGKSKGVFWYSFNDTQKDNRAYFAEMKPVMLEFRKFTDMLKEAPEKAKIFNWAKDNNLYMALFDYKYLVLVNNWPVKQKVNRWMENIVFGNWDLKAWGSSRETKAQIRNNRLTMEESIEPWESFVWELVEVKK